MYIDKKIKDEIISGFEKSNFKAGRSIRKKYPMIFDYLKTQYGFEKISEAIYFLKTGKIAKCKRGNSLSFNSFVHGYRNFCNVAEKCECARESIKEKISQYMNTLSDEEKEIQKEKRTQTNLEKFGVENAFQSVDIKEKIKNVNMKKYGVDHYSKTDYYVDKFKTTNMKKYGVEHYSKTDEFVERIKQTSIEKYGVEYYSKTDEFKEKVKQSNLERYGVENPMFVDEIKERAKNTNMERYGVENPMLLTEFKEKAKHTNIEKYGVEHHGKKHYNPDYINLFGDPAQFKELLYNYGTYKLAELVNCDISTIHYISKQYDIPLPPRSNSHQEEIIHEFLENNNISHIMNTRRILSSGKELDFYFPDYNLSIEVNGLYWHSEISGGKDKSYHYNKWKECNDLGITLLSIYEDEFYNKQQFWFNKILYMSGKLLLKKIHARKCKVVELNNVDDFLNEHHLQSACRSSYKLGLVYDNELVSVMTFSKPRNNKFETIDLSRFCNHSGYLVTGGASKLLNYFIKTYGNNYKEIISFSDNNYSNGNVYKSLGFSLEKDLPPDYKYTKGISRYHKAGFRKSSIFKKFDIPNELKNATEWELMQYLGFDRIWDSGKKKWIMKI